MLQQTQVATVINHFDRFIEQFPDVFELQRASQEEVLAAWHGLGYYRRAINMSRTADVIVSEYEGKISKDSLGIEFNARDWTVYCWFDRRCSLERASHYPRC